MTKFFHHSGLSLLPLLVLVLTTITATARRNSHDWDSEALKRKADYVYLEAVTRALSGDKEDAYYELLKYAHSLNPSDLAINKDYGLMMYMVENDDSLMSAQGIRMMRQYFDAHPEDYFAGIQYALINRNYRDWEEALRAFAVIHRQFPRRTQVTRRYADMLAMTGNRDSIKHALELYDSLEVIEGTSLEMSSSRVNLLYMLNDTAAIINEGRTNLRRAPMAIENNVFMADIFSAMGAKDSALVYYNKAVEIDSLNPQAAFSRAMFFNSIGDSVAYDREIFKVLKLEDLPMPTKMRVLRDYVSDLYADSLQRPRVLSLFDRLVAIHPHEPDIRKMYALYLASIKRYDDSAEQQDLGMNLEPDDEEGWLNLAAFYNLADKKDAVIKAIDRGLHYFPENDDLYLIKASYYLEQDSFQQALDAFRAGLEYCDSTDIEKQSDIITGIGDVMTKQNLTDSAITFYNKAIALNPTNLGALNNCAYFLAKKGEDLDRALEMITRVMERSEPSATWLDTYAWILFVRGDYEKAKENIDKVLEMYRDNPDDEISAEVLEHAGDIYFCNEEHDKALDFWQQAIRLDPDNKELARKIRQKNIYDE